jgi:hypothetical protein
MVKLQKYRIPTSELKLYKNNTNSVNNKVRGKKRLSSYIKEKKINLYRAKSTGYNTINSRGGVSFYGTSIYDVKSYNKEPTKIFYRMELTSDLDLNTVIVDLNLPKNSRIIVDYFNANVDTGKNLNENDILLDTLFFSMDLEKTGKLPEQAIVSRNSDDLDDDLKMVKILKKLFPGKIGSYTSGSYGLKHNEVIIWDNGINKQISNTKNNNRTKKRKSLETANKPKKSKKIRTSGTPSTPISFSLGG